MTIPLILHSDCLPLLRTFGDNTIDSVITDPPYGLNDHKPGVVVSAITAWVTGDRERVPDGKGFMGKQWDAFVPPPAVWDEVLRVLKPGGYLLCFAGSRTVDLMGLSIRLAGFQLRDSIEWLYGSGFPKSHDISKAIDKQAGAERNITNIGSDGAHRAPRAMAPGGAIRTAVQTISEPATEAAKQWNGWGTALKPGHEPIIVAQKPIKRTIAANVLEHGTGGLNIDACRIAFKGDTSGTWGNQQNPDRHNSVPGGNGTTFDGGPTKSGVSQRHEAGRWPANVVLTHASTPEGYGACTEECVDGCPVATLDAQGGMGYHGASGERGLVGITDAGGASRFYPVFRYQAKAPKSERPMVNGKSHPTIKPLALMRWLVKLITPPGGVVLDPFAGSGTTGQAAQLEGFASVLIEKDPESMPFIYQRFGLGEWVAS